ncbi:MAG: tripartite tricarboxylate transporter substrate binding protein [Alphaproteobacteria bacterium]|nr:MAG: tripartite tricarboxylate transporter substrate binding protein [Alphaproteobacteria bacterium]
MNASRRLIVAMGAALAGWPTATRAWPDRPVRIIVGFQAGGSSDVVARILAEQLRPQLGGAAVLVDNKPGASGTLAAEAVLSARDGHSLIVLGDSLVTASLTNKSVRVRPLRDFRAISLICEGTLVVLASERAPFHDFAAFVAHVKAHPGEVNYVTAGLGSQQHLTAEYIFSALKLEMTHVPMRGGAQATQDLVGGQVEAAVLGLGPTLPHIRSGKLRALAVTAPARSPQLPDVPTLAELGVTGFAVSQWFGLGAPADTPEPTVNQLAQAVAKGLDDDAARRRLEEIGFAARWTSPAEFADKMRADEARWRRLIVERGLKLD